MKGCEESWEWWLIAVIAALQGRGRREPETRAVYSTKKLKSQTAQQMCIGLLQGHRYQSTDIDLSLLTQCVGNGDENSQEFKNNL